MNLGDVRPSKYLWPTLAACVVAVLIYFGFAVLVGFDNAANALSSVSAQTWIYVLALSIFSFVARFFRWHWWLAHQRAVVTKQEGLVFYLAGFAFTATPAKVGEVIRLWYLRRRFAVPFSKSAPLFVFEQFIDVMSVAVLAALAVNVIFPNLGAAIWIVCVIGVLPAVSITLRRGAGLGRLLIASLAGRWIRKVGGDEVDLDLVVESIRAQAGLPIITASVLWGLIAWCAPGVGLFLIVRDLGYEIGLATAIGFFSLSLLAGVFSVFSAGLGTTEGALMLLLAAQGVDPAAAFSAALVSRGSTLWFAAGVGALMLVPSTCIVKTKRSCDPGASETPTRTK